MNIDLNSSIARASKQLEAWWDNTETKRPCMVIHVPRLGSVIPDTDNLEKFWTDVDFVMSRNMALIENRDYFGEAVPFHFVDFGASAMPCALGARPEYVNKETVWAHPCYDSIEQVLELGLDDQNRCYKAILDITRESVRRARGHHMVSIYPLNGLTDILAGMYGTVNLMVDMIEKPGLVKQAMGHFKELWIEEFRNVSEILKGGGNRGGIGWAGVWAPGTTFPIQEDASYMLSPEMFREFCIPHLHDIIGCMEYPMYHLDGIGALGHLESLLEIEKLKVIQWVPGAGKEDMPQWYDLIKYIIKRGKSVQVFAKPGEVRGLAENVGARGLLVTVLGASREQAEEMGKFFDVRQGGAIG